MDSEPVFVVLRTGERLVEVPDPFGDRTVHHNGGAVDRAEGEQGFDQLPQARKFDGERAHRNFVVGVDQMEVGAADRGLMLFHERDLASDLVRVHQIVRAKPGHIFAVSDAHAVVQRTARASVGFAKIADTGAKRIELMLMHRRAVVNDDNFDIRIRLIQHAGDRLIDIGTVVKRNNDANERKESFVMAASNLSDENKQSRCFIVCGQGVSRHDA